MPLRFRTLSMIWLLLRKVLLGILVRPIKPSWIRRRLIWKLPREVTIYFHGSNLMPVSKLILKVYNFNWILLFFMTLLILIARMMMEFGVLTLTLTSLMLSFTRKVSLLMLLTSLMSIGAII